jgi:hypothetical protein
LTVGFGLDADFAAGFDALPVLAALNVGALATTSLADFGFATSFAAGLPAGADFFAGAALAAVAGLFGTAFSAGFAGFTALAGLSSLAGAADFGGAL